MSYKWKITYTDANNIQQTAYLEVNPSSANFREKNNIQINLDLTGSKTTLVIGDYSKDSFEITIKGCSESEFKFWRELAKLGTPINIKDHVYVRAEEDGIFPPGITSLDELKEVHHFDALIADVDGSYRPKTVPQRYDLRIRIIPT